MDFLRIFLMFIPGPCWGHCSCQQYHDISFVQQNISVVLYIIITWFEITVSGIVVTGIFNNNGKIRPGSTVKRRPGSVDILCHPTNRYDNN